MPERRAYIDQQAKVIEVHGIDLLAQVEALLRMVAEYQRQSLRLQGRGTEPAPAETRRAAGAAIQKCVRELKELTTTLSGTLDEVEEAAAALGRILRSGKSA